MIRLLANRSPRSQWNRFCAAMLGICTSCVAIATLIAAARADEAPAANATVKPDEAAATVAAGSIAETAAADAKAAKDESRVIRARFSDGTILVGELLLDELEVETEFGSLVVPRAELLGIAPGLDSREGFDARLDRWIAELTAPDQATAAAAERELSRLGPAAADELTRRAATLPADGAKRIAALVERLHEAQPEFDEFDDQQARALIRKDRIRTTKFEIIGRIVPQELRFASRYGELTVGIGDIVAVERQSDGAREDIAKTLTVTGQNLAQTQMKPTGVTIRKGDRISVRASGTIHRTPGNTTYVSSPDGNSRFGTHPTDPQILGGALIARIGKQGNDIKVGSNGSFVAGQDGTLAFGIAMRQDYVGRYPFPGEYKVQLRVERGD